MVQQRQGRLLCPSSFVVLAVDYSHPTQTNLTTNPLVADRGGIVASECMSYLLCFCVSCCIRPVRRLDSGRADCADAASGTVQRTYCSAAAAATLSLISTAYESRVTTGSVRRDESVSYNKLQKRRFTRTFAPRSLSRPTQINLRTYIQGYTATRATSSALCSRPRLAARSRSAHRLAQPPQTVTADMYHTHIHATAVRLVTPRQSTQYASTRALSVMRPVRAGGTRSPSLLRLHIAFMSRSLVWL